MASESPENSVINLFNSIFFMNTIPKVLLAIAGLALFSSCKKVTGDGPVVTEIRNTGNFSTISTAVAADVYLTQAPGYGIKISAQQNILNVLQTYTSGNELNIKSRNNVILGRRERIIIEVSAPEIHRLTQSGSGDIVVADTLRTTNLILRLSGSGNMSLPGLEAKTLSAEVRGSGSIRISGGHLETEDLAISGSGEINTANVPAKKVTTATSGSGKMQVQALQDLYVTISGSGLVLYKGNPAVHSKVSGSGKLKKL